MAPVEQLRDLYAVLGVREDADGFDIRRVFREKVRELRLETPHGPEADERLRELTHAYAVLSNVRSRRLYDQFASGVVSGGEGPVESGSPSDEWLEADEALSRWVFPRERRPASQPVTATASAAVDRLPRLLASVGFFIALLLLVVLLLRG